MNRLLCLLSLVLTATPAAAAPDRPNILFALADDWSWPHGGVYGDPVVKTPVFDRVAAEGMLFSHVFSAAPTCSASRAAILTGQAPHRLEEGANLWGILPKCYPVYPDLLEAAGYHVGYMGKGWGPGSLEGSGRTRNPAGPQFKNFAEFLKTVPAGQPFCFWYGSRDPHRAYVKGSGLKAGLDPAKVVVPAFLPDTPEVRSDILDYYFAVQRYDHDTGELLKLLAETGRLDNTIVVMTGDNGWPFPRAKANLYDAGTRQPLAVRWPARIKGGQKSDAFISFVDFAPTFLEAAGLKPPAQMTGRSFLDLLLTGQSAVKRDQVFLERERHANVRRGDLSYPIRAVRTRDFLYIRNLRPDRWPAGDPEMYKAVGPFGDIDGSPSKELLLTRRDDKKIKPYFDAACAKRPAEELYRIAGDPEQRTNLASRLDFAAVKRHLRAELDRWMKETGDPRATVDDDRWDKFPYFGREPRPVQPGGKGEPKEEARQVKRPNVVWIVADDHAPYVYGAYGNRQVHTPNLDRLAAEGMRFDRAFCNSPVCTASRQSFLTGRYPRSIGVTQLQTPLPANETTLAETLHVAGYDTAAIGKMHFNSSLKHGFDVRIDKPEHSRDQREHGRHPLPSGVEVLPPWKPFRDPARVWLNGFYRPFGATDEDMAGTYFARQATTYLQQPHDKPFFLVVSFYEPHSPFHFPVEYRGRHDPQSFAVPRPGPEDDDQIPAIFRDLTDREKQGIIASYYTSVEFLDKNVGLVLNALAQSGKAADTLVFYLGDHGYMLGQHGRFEKHCCFEPSVRAPLVARFPGRVKPGQSTQALVEFIDIVPTVLEYCGVPVPARVQGRSLVPLLQGATPKHRDRALVEYSENAEAMVRTERWKLIYSTGKRERQDGYATGKPLPGRTVRLYDLQKDPDELTNLAGRPEHAGLVAQLTADLADHLKRTARQPELVPATSDVYALLEFCLQPRDVKAKPE